MSNTNKDAFNVADLDAALNADDRADLVNVLKNKLQDLAGKHSDVLENLSISVRKRVDVLREIQAHHDELEAKFFEERAALEAKYQKLYQPLYVKRYEIVNGVEVGGATADAESRKQADNEGEEKGVPDFWLTAMKNNEVLAEEISERDEGALKFLQDIKWSRVENPKGFKLEFYFDTNPFFKNSILTKTYHMIDEDEPILEKAIGTEIEWYPGKCLTQKILKKKPKKGSKNAKPITKTEQCESFFNFFSPPQVPEEDEDIDEDAAEELQNLMEQDYDIGSSLSSYGNHSTQFKRTTSVARNPVAMQQKITISNKRGEKLFGVLHETGSAKVAVLCHGFRSSKEYNTIVNLAHVLENNGISAFRFDFSGNGESEGSFLFGNYLSEVEDLRAVTEYFNSVNRAAVVVLGHSKGGNVVLLYASKYHDIPAVVNVSGRYDLKRGLEERLGKNFSERLNKDGYIDIKTRTGEVEYQVTKESMMDRLNTNMHEACLSVDKRCRVLTVHGSADEVIPVEDALEFAKIIPNHQLQIVEGANHGYTIHQDELSSVVLPFIKECIQQAEDVSE
ncbi:hypothetical protein F511_15595 [Dorcoceras hygrometricum]|uniref:Serine aminopeptidase S33 domain-containing protein n=1 Tax=Dorcoceras hygrometricum TaxID=472368 RepID=A0A2Z7B405_9LAMI|nr:hypothetical protein F511_15595 [Dorcoceras hygrometricum]